MEDKGNIPHFKGQHEYKGIVFPNIVLDSSIERLKSFQVRDDDIWIVTFPKAGTHWMMEIIGLILSGGDPDKIDRSLYCNTVEMINLDQRFPQTEEEEKLHPLDMSPFLDVIERAPSPRAMLTHLQFDLLPRDILKSKIVYLARNPKDMIVSWFQFIGYNPAKPLTMEKSIEEFVDGKMQWGPWPVHVRTFWELKDHENVTFIFYEDLKKEPAKYIEKIAKGIGHPLSEEVLQKVVKFSHIDSQKATFKKLEESGKVNYVKASGELAFLNKGVSYRWKQFFTVAQNEAFDEWYQDNMADTDLKFTFE
ncbi:sulfotransferase 1C4-like [Lytechinus variegatus]|uniref:sulfotransferase 1C4-like n=1 Tax=Lytechinus variegatus TaxID=7654 RepID=UPI001BB21A60|nr:sulfotransferase 1C4-like [Lytechinus variegatus]